MMNGGGGIFFGGGFMWIFWLLVIVAIFAVARSIMGSSASGNDSKSDSPLSILEKRYARGEIDREEYLEKKRELER
jgi:putative membrane protein